MQRLVAWKNAARRIPLVIRGARQVGKTWLMREFGREHFGSVAYINFDNNPRMRALFEGGFEIPRLLAGLQLEARVKITPETLLIFDEVQTSPARLGTWFGYQHFGVRPDILTTAKAIAGGFPLGVILAEPGVASFLKPGTHASTFGGNSLGCAAGIAAWKATWFWFLIRVNTITILT